jgi:outer membrane beta-barrel protein
MVALAASAGPVRGQPGAPESLAVDRPAPAAPDSSVVEPLPAPDSSAVGDRVDPPARAPRGPAAPAPHGERPATTRKVRLERSDNNVARSGPGQAFAIVGVYPRRAAFPVIAKSGEWYDVRLSPTQTGWFHASLCREFDDLSDLEFRPNPKLFTRTGSYVLTGYGGAYAYDRKSNSLVLGGRLGYYVFDRLQVEGGLAWTRVRRPREIVEELFGLSLEAEDFHMLFYHLVLTWEVLPGRQMVPFVSGGVGSSIMQGETEPSFNLGAGTTLFLSRRTAMRWEFRHYRFSSGSDNARVANNNIEFTLGTALLF